MKLKEYMLTTKVKQKDLAEKIGVTQGYVCGVINGRYVPKGNMAIRFSKATNWIVRPHDINPNDYPNATDGIS